MKYNNELKLVVVDSKYCDFLRRFDKRVPFNFGKKDLRPFIGVLFEVNNCMYFSPLSSPKPKHLKMKDKIDFLKLDNGKLGAINFNNMIPVTQKNIKEINLNRKYKDHYKNQYYILLKKQLYWLNRYKNRLYGRSSRLYRNYIFGNLDKGIYSVCCNFPLLEQKCIEYNSKEIVNN